ncbi:MAG: hypothetical protein R2745_00330 [Vicinamibacterales bacterium]
MTRIVHRAASVPAMVLLAVLPLSAQRPRSDDVVTTGDADALKGRRAMAIEIRLTDGSEARAIRADVATFIEGLGIRQLPAGQLPVFRLDIDSQRS